MKPLMFGGNGPDPKGRSDQYLSRLTTPLTPPPLHHTTPMGKLSPELDVMGTWGWRRRHWRLRMGQW